MLSPDSISVPRDLMAVTDLIGQNVSGHSNLLQDNFAHLEKDFKE
jgi:hypothetical protein